MLAANLQGGRDSLISYFPMLMALKMKGIRFRPPCIFKFELIRFPQTFAHFCSLFICVLLLLNINNMKFKTRVGGGHKLKNIFIFNIYFAQQPD